jgi:glycosyltransferase involved in cell wall biosynthesis
MVHAAALLAPRPAARPAPAAGGIGVVGELNRASGLGEQARMLLRGLESLGVPGWAVPISALPGEAGALPRDLPPHAPLVVSVNAPLLPLALLRLGRAALRQRRIVGYWAWELPTLPAEWQVGFRFVHEIWAPSAFTATALQTQAKGTVRVVPIPLAVAPPLASGLTRGDFGLPEGAVVTLVSFSLASSLERKNPLAAIAAHRAAFGDRADRVLVLKIGQPQDFPGDFETIRAAAVGDNIRIETRTLPPADNYALTRAADIVLSLHRSEGFGLVPAEAMLLGRPVVVTGFSGNLDFMDEASAALVPYRLVPARDPRGVFQAPGAMWADADVGAAAEWLRRLAEDGGLRARLGAAGQAMATARLGTDKLRDAVEALGLACAS